jgi:hypothetical protein
MSNTPTPHDTNPDTDTDTDADETESDSLYFNDTTERVEALEDQIDDIRGKQQALRELDDATSTIDCDHGTATLTIDEPNGRVEATMSVRRLSAPVEAVLHGFEWSVKFSTGYDTRSRLFQFELEGRLKTFYK